MSHTLISYIGQMAGCMIDVILIYCTLIGGCIGKAHRCIYLNGLITDANTESSELVLFIGDLLTIIANLCGQFECKLI